MVDDGCVICYVKYMYDMLLVGVIVGGMSMYVNGVMNVYVGCGVFVIIDLEQVYVCNFYGLDVWVYWMVYVDVLWFVWF